MLNLVEIRNQQAVTSSQLVADVFKKQHKHVLEAIEKVKAENSAVTTMFFESTYTAGTGKSYKMYYMNRDGLSLLVMGFTGKKALSGNSNTLRPSTRWRRNSKRRSFRRTRITAHG